MGLLEAIIISVIAASTPLLLAAAGELVVERSGVLNLGTEGMMIMGAACGFAGAYLTGSTFVGALFGIAAGSADSALLANLLPGTYSVVIQSADASTGIARSMAVRKVSCSRSSASEGSRTR